MDGFLHAWTLLHRIFTRQLQQVIHTLVAVANLHANLGV
jgi:hypothetical protein